MKKLILFIFMMSLFLLPGCEKYPDGPIFSIYPAAARISGDWDIKYLYENGHDISGAFRHSPCYSVFHFITQEKGVSKGRFYCDYKIIGNDTCDSGGYWALNSSKTHITMYGGGKSNYYSSLVPLHLPNYQYHVEVKWRIRRLTFKDFWLTANYKNKEYELIFGK